MPKFPDIPGYKFVKVLGRGGMADVYLAVQKNLNRMVAIKILIPSVFRDSLFLKRFKREAQTLSKLVHPNIITVYDVGKTGDSYYIVMEYLQESLKERVKTYRRRNPDEALLLVKQVAGALFYAHRIGFIHRDIKPDNIMFRKDGIPVILDFGIARPINASTKLTKTGMSIGTPSYISPEQAKGEKVDGRSDIYSLGVVLFEMLSGRVPYKAENTLGVILKHIKSPIPRLPSQLKKYQHVIDRLMEKEKRKRIRSEEAFNNLIKSVLDIQFMQHQKPQKAKKSKPVERFSKTKEISQPISSVKTDYRKKPVSEKGSDKKKKKFPLFRVSLVITLLGVLTVMSIRYLNLGSDEKKLNTETVKALVKKNNFFDRVWNKYGRFNNQFEKKFIKQKMVIVDYATGLMWIPYGSRREMNYDGIKKWLSYFNREKYAGFGDWRLPTLKEAASLLNIPQTEDSLYLPLMFSTRQKKIWTSNIYGFNGAWVVCFDEGYILGCPFDLKYFIRPVRSLK